MNKILSTTWGKVTAGVAILGTLAGWYSNTVDWYESEINEFIEKSIIESVEIKNDTIFATYHTAPLPNVDYTTEYWIANTDDFRAQYKLNYADTIKKNSQPEIVYETYSRWRGYGIPIPKLEPGRYEIYIKYDFKGHTGTRIMKPIKFNIDERRYSREDLERAKQSEGKDLQAGDSD